jgi:hypothetical protein
MPAGIPSDKRQNELNLDFNSTLRLVELGLMSDGSDWPKYQNIVKQYAEGEGRRVAIVILNGIGQEMFGRAPWDKWIN